MKSFKINHAILLLISLILLSCNTKYKDKEVKKCTVKKFPATINITAFQESKDDIFNYAYVDLKLSKDYVIVVDRKSDEILRFLDKENLNLLFSKVPKGRGPNEILLPGTLQLKGDTLFLLDKVKKQLHQYDLKKLTSHVHFTPDKIYNIPILSVVDAKIIEPNNILVSGNVDEGLVCSIDTLGSKIKVFGNAPDGYPNGYNNVGYFNVSNIFRIDLFPKSEGFIVSSLFSDKLQIFNKYGKETMNITGPDFIMPKFNLIKNQFLIDEESKFGYVTVVIKEKYIYGLYSGLSQKEMKNHDKYPTSSILVFKHNGTPKKRFNLDKDIKTFDVDEENGIFYTLQLNPSNKIFKYKYEIH